MASSETSVVRMSSIWSRENPKSAKAKIPIKRRVWMASEVGDPIRCEARRASASSLDDFAFGGLEMLCCIERVIA